MTTLEALFYGIPFIVFCVAFMGTRYWIRLAKSRSFVGKDMNKKEHPEVAEGGGFPVVLSVAFGFFLYIALKAIVGASDQRFLEAFALVSGILLAGFIGFVDDVLGWKKGLPQWFKVLLTFPIALPFLSLALLFPDLGVGLQRFIPLDSTIAHAVYSFFLVPIGVIGATNALNILAGFNGLEAGMGAVILFFFGLKALLMGELHVALFAGIGVAALLAFLFFNWYPAKVFPGDTLPYAIGALVAGLAIFGNMEIFGVILFLPYFIEIFLKLRSRIEMGKWAENFGIPQEDGSLKPRYEKVYSLTHILQRLPGMTEKKLVITMILSEVVVGLVALFLA